MFLAMGMAAAISTTIPPLQKFVLLAMGMVATAEVLACVILSAVNWDPRPQSWAHLFSLLKSSQGWEWVEFDVGILFL